MRAAPEMVPSLDDALLALDGFPGRVPDIGLAVRFLEQLNSVRDVPAVIPDQLQAAALEGAYQAGFRCVDESGHVLVVSLPDLLAYAPAPRPSWLARVRQWFGALAAPCPPDCPECRPLGVALGPSALMFDSDELDHWKARALAAEKKIRDEQFERLFAVPNGGKHAG